MATMNECESSKAACVVELGSSELSRPLVSRGCFVLDLITSFYLSLLGKF